VHNHAPSLALQESNVPSTLCSVGSASALIGVIVPLNCSTRHHIGNRLENVTEVEIDCLIAWLE